MTYGSSGDLARGGDHRNATTSPRPYPGRYPGLPKSLLLSIVTHTALVWKNTFRAGKQQLESQLGRTEQLLVYLCQPTGRPS